MENLVKFYGAHVYRFRFRFKFFILYAYCDEYHQRENHFLDAFWFRLSFCLWNCDNFRMLRMVLRPASSFPSRYPYLHVHVQKMHCQIIQLPRISDCLPSVCWDHRVDRADSRHHRWRSTATRMAMIMQPPITQHDDDGGETYDDSTDHCLGSIVSIVVAAYYTSPSICYCSHSVRPYVCLQIEIQWYIKRLYSASECEYEYDFMINGIDTNYWQAILMLYICVKWWMVWITFCEWCRWSLVWVRYGCEQCNSLLYAGRGFFRYSELPYMALNHRKRNK